MHHLWKWCVIKNVYVRKCVCDASNYYTQQPTARLYTRTGIHEFCTPAIRTVFRLFYNARKPSLNRRIIAPVPRRTQPNGPVSHNRVPVRHPRHEPACSTLYIQHTVGDFVTAAVPKPFPWIRPVRHCLRAGNVPFSPSGAYSQCIAVSSATSPPPLALPRHPVRGCARPRGAVCPGQATRFIRATKSARVCMPRFFWHPSGALPYAAALSVHGTVHAARGGASKFFRNAPLCEHFCGTAPCPPLRHSLGAAGVAASPLREAEREKKERGK